MEKNKDKKEIVEVKAEFEIVKSKSPAELMATALEKGFNAEEVNNMLSAQERWEANEAKKLYNIAMAKVHAKMPSVAKTEQNDQTHSSYASLEGVVRVAKPVYSGEGFAVSFYEGENAPEGHVRVCIDITHSAGHRETRHYDMPLDGKGLKGNANMIPIHAKASSFSYGRRYLMCMVFNIPTGDDDDANTAGVVEYIDDEQLSSIKDYIDNFKKFDEERFLKFAKVGSLGQLLKSDFTKIMIILERKKKEEEKTKEAKEKK